MAGGQHIVCDPGYSDRRRSIPAECCVLDIYRKNDNRPEQQIPWTSKSYNAHAGFVIVLVRMVVGSANLPWARESCLLFWVTILL